MLDAAPQAIGMDIKLRKLRFVRRPGRALVNGSVFALPFQNAAFEVVVCSEVIEHIPESPTILDELLRVLEPGGSLVLGTPDYGSWQWPFIEKLYGFFQRGGYADEHITHYTRASLLKALQERGLEVLETQWICGAEMIMHARKPLN
jgi:ubiquinone/menaquinone biosynthesis C-methylase UbiE